MRLTSGQRARLAGSTFGLPGQRAYPMPDAAHAANAKARAAQEANAGRLSANDKARIDSKADRMLSAIHGRH